MTKEISRILKTGGIYFIISYGRPEYRLYHLERKHLAFDVKVVEINSKKEKEVSSHFAYICKKLPEAKNKINNLDIVLKEMGNKNSKDINPNNKSIIKNKKINEKQVNSNAKNKINKKK